MGLMDCLEPPERVLPLTREWIEIAFFKRYFEIVKVLPLTREWIEM